MHIIMDLVGNELAQVEDEFKKNLKSKVSLISKIGEHLLLSGALYSFYALNYAVIKADAKSKPPV